MEEKGFLLGFPAWTGIPNVENTHTHKYTAAEAQMSLETYPAALLNPAGMCPG